MPLLQAYWTNGLQVTPTSPLHTSVAGSALPAVEVYVGNGDDPPLSSRVVSLTWGAAVYETTYYSWDATTTPDPGVDATTLYGGGTVVLVPDQSAVFVRGTVSADPVSAMAYLDGDQMRCVSGYIAIARATDGDFGSAPANADTHMHLMLLDRDGSDLYELPDKLDSTSWGWGSNLNANLGAPACYGFRVYHDSAGSANPPAWGIADIWLFSRVGGSTLRQRQSPVRSPSRVGWGRF